ncbi:MAG: hypothetical protein KAI18_02375 [Candidatus Aenigmarchaeota archaeon]|nr:hypothetical protein [Candidatus Aenigmarchaeota archaeon]
MSDYLFFSKYYDFIAGGSQNLFVPFILDSIDRAFWTTRVFAVCRK